MNSPTLIVHTAYDLKRAFELSNGDMDIQYEILHEDDVWGITLDIVDGLLAWCKQK